MSQYSAYFSKCTKSTWKNVYSAGVGYRDLYVSLKYTWLLVLFKYSMSFYIFFWPTWYSSYRGGFVYLVLLGFVSYTLKLWRCLPNEFFSYFIIIKCLCFSWVTFCMSNRGTWVSVSWQLLEWHIPLSIYPLPSIPCFQPICVLTLVMPLVITI